MDAFWNVPDKVDLIRFIAQWCAVISTIIALVFSMRFSALKAQREAQRQDYAEVATWNYKGAQSISKDYSLPGPLSGWADDYVRDTPNGKEVRFDDAAISHFESTLQKYPRYPFSYYFLAEAFRLKGDSQLAHKYARKGMSIFEITTNIPLHSPDHDDALKNLREAFGDLKKP
jgi:hypothetical protein